MPLLQHTLFMLWAHRQGRWLRLEPYRKMGGLHKSIADTADTIYKNYRSRTKESEPDLMRLLFISLTRIDRNIERDKDHQDTRRRLEIGAIKLAGVTQEQVHRLVDELTSARLIVKHERRKSTDPSTAPIELAHEAIIQHWGMMRTWLDQDRTNLRFFEQVREAALEWERKGHKPDDLLHIGRVQESLAVADEMPVNPTECDRRYLQACLAAEVARELAQLDRTISVREAEYARDLFIAGDRRVTLALYIRPDTNSPWGQCIFTARVPGEFLMLEVTSGDLKSEER
jgi:hypothetical protein